MAAEGVKFVTNCEVGKDYPAEKLRTEFDAIVLCGGATKPQRLLRQTEGRNLKGIHFAMEFLHANTKSLLDSQHADGQYISAKDKDVIVIGGGDTGTDCVGTSLRHGCKSLVQFEIVPKPPLERAAGQSLAAVAEGLQARLRPGRGQGRSAATTRASTPSRRRSSSATSNGHVKEIAHGPRRVGQGQRPGRRRGTSPAPRRSSRPSSCCWRMGFCGPENQLLDQLGVEKDPRTNAKAEHGKFATSVPGVFAAGDMRRGQSLVVWAINEGRGAARECDRYLMGETDLP